MAQVLRDGPARPGESRRESAGGGGGVSFAMLLAGVRLLLREGGVDCSCLGTAPKLCCAPKCGVGVMEEERPSGECFWPSAAFIEGEKSRLKGCCSLFPALCGV